MDKDSTLIIWNFEVINSEINVNKLIYITNNLKYYELINSQLSNSTVKSNTILMNTYTSKQIYIQNITVNQLWYYDSNINSDTYLFFIDKLDLNSELNSSISNINMDYSDVGLIRFGGIINTIPLNVSKLILFKSISITNTFLKNLASNLWFQYFEFNGDLFI